MIRPDKALFFDRYSMVDMHCHLGFAPNAQDLARAAHARNVAAFCNTCSPAEYLRLHRELGAHDNIVVGFGMHPWNIADDTDARIDFEQIVSPVHECRAIGEVGLDFAPRHSDTRDMQITVFQAIIRACTPGGSTAGYGGNLGCSEPPQKIISIHAVRAAAVVLDILERFDTPKSCACIFHWFSGSSAELRRAVNLGCYFSVGERMLASKRGRAYVRQIPCDRLLLETDLPDEKTSEPFDPGSWLSSLERARAMVAEIRA